MRKTLYYMSKENNRHVIIVDGITKKGFTNITRGNARGMDKITETTLDTYYSECTKEHFNKFIRNTNAR